MSNEEKKSKKKKRCLDYGKVRKKKKRENGENGR